MKELSIEKKAKRYDKAIERAEGLIDFCSDSELKTLEYVFPELKESKDEKIRKVIYSWIYTQPSQFFDSGFSKEEMLAWLEKQGEQKPVIEMKSAEESLGIDSNTYNKIVDECIYGEQKSDDVEEVNFFDDFRKTDSEVEPKFKVEKDKWYVCTSQYCNCIEGRNYKASLDGRIIDDYGTEYDMHDDAYRWFRPWTIQDAKAGDILVCGKDKRPFIFKDLLDKFHPNNPVAYCGIDCGNKFFISIGTIWWTDEEVEPATKEQRNLLFQKMRESGYKWDAEKKELRKIERKFNIGDEIKTSNEESLTITKIDEKGYWSEDLFICNFDDADKWKLVEQKPAWSEEDDKILKSIIINIENLQFSEDMREKYHHIPNANKSYYQIKIDWLKSIRERVVPQQKQGWSEEDKEVINLLLELIYEQDKISPRIPSNEKRKMMLSWLKSLKDRYTWKPSEEQMRVLDLAIRCGINRGTTEETTLVSLFNDLKKLI